MRSADRDRRLAGDGRGDHRPRDGPRARASRRSSSSGRPARSSCAAASGSKPGQKVLLVEDVVTTGLSSREAIAAVEEAGGEVIAAAALVDRSNGEADLGVPFFPLIRLDVPAYRGRRAAARARRDSRREAGQPEGGVSDADAPSPPRRQYRSCRDDPQRARRRPSRSGARRLRRGRRRRRRDHRPSARGPAPHHRRAISTG